MSFRILLIITLSLLGEDIYAQKINKSVIKAEMSIRLLKHITWKNEKDIQAFNIGFIGVDQEYFNNLEHSIIARNIRGKEITLTKLDNIEQLTNIHLLIVASQTKQPFTKIAIKARQTNTLVVSEIDNYQIHIMINFYVTPNNNLEFELNRSNILLAQLKISKDILILGGNELDMAELYREMGNKLYQLSSQLDTTQKQSNIAKLALNESQQQLNNINNELKNTQSRLSSANRALDKNKKIIKNQEKNITLRKQQLKNVGMSANKQNQLLEKQEKELNGHAQKIKLQQERVENNELLLQQQQQELLLRKSDIVAQKSKIDDQQLWLYVSLVILFMFLLFLFWLYKLNQDKKRVSIKLAKRGEHLEEEVKERTTAVRESEMRYRALSELSPVGVFQTDINGKCLYVNERWCEYSGLTREQAIGYGWLNAIHPFERSKLSKTWTDNLQSEQVLNSKHRYITPNGVIRWVFGQCDAEYDADGIIKGYIGAVTDLTNQRNLEEQLRRTQKMDALGKLTGGIAHDYNNMLGIIIGYSELIEDIVSEQPKLTKYINVIKHAGKRGAKLTKKLLTFSRKKSSENQIVNINTLLEGTQLMIEKTLTVRIKQVYDLEKNIWLINVDEGDLEDAILNMSINAMHAIEGNGQLTFETRNEVIKEVDAQNLVIPTGNYVLLSITDTGCGMDDKTKENIFDPFFSTKGEFGTGLGLSQVYGLMQRSKGNVKIYSERGHGSRFTLYFPRYYESGAEEKQFKKEKENNLSGKEIILVVDDEPALAEWTSVILTKHGYQVFIANSGKEALLILEKEPVDVLVSDVIMPNMDGYRLATLVQDKYPKIKIQLASGFNDSRHVDKVNVSLQEKLLPKPYHSEKLLLRIRELLNDSAD